MGVVVNSLLINKLNQLLVIWENLTIWHLKYLNASTLKNKLNLIGIGLMFIHLVKLF